MTSMKPQILRGGVVVALLAVSACTMKKQEAPDLAGPSEYATSVSVAVTPDVITQDGASQGVVTVTARGPNGEALPNLAMRAEIRVDNIPTDFGTLSARNIVTGADGRATLVYTAPAAPAGLAVDTFTIVDIGITPVGNNFGNSTTRFASLRLVPRGQVVVPSNLQAAFTASPSTAGERQTILFDASPSTAPANNPIVSYLWHFDDGSSASGRTVGHAYNAAGTYIVTLTVSDALGRTAQSSQGVTINPSAAPSANFVFSPAEPTANSNVIFNGLTSTAAAGRQIVSYAWDFGDPNDRTPATGPQATHRFTRAGNYTVVLTVTDDLGRSGTTSAAIEIQ